MKNKILIVDDNTNNLLVLEGILEPMPLNIVKATSGKEALKVILREHIDMVLLDVKMPIMNGFQVAELIRNRNKTRELPILFLTGAIDDEYERFRNKYPENVACILKPIDIDTVKSHINQYLDFE